MMRNVCLAALYIVAAVDLLTDYSASRCIH